MHMSWTVRQIQRSPYPKTNRNDKKYRIFFLISSIFEKIKEMGIQEHILKNTFKIEI